MPTHEGACAPAPDSKSRNTTTEAVARQIRTRRRPAAEFHDPVVGHGDLHYRVDKLWCKPGWWGFVCTKGYLALIDAADTKIEGARAVVLGRSNIVGLLK